MAFGVATTRPSGKLRSVFVFIVPLASVGRLTGSHGGNASFAPSPSPSMRAFPAGAGGHLPPPGDPPPPPETSDSDRQPERSEDDLVSEPSRSSGATGANRRAA